MPKTLLTGRSIRAKRTIQLYTTHFHGEKAAETAGHDTKATSVPFNPDLVMGSIQEAIRESLGSGLGYLDSHRFSDQTLLLPSSTVRLSVPWVKFTNILADFFGRPVFDSNLDFSLKSIPIPPESGPIPLYQTFHFRAIKKLVNPRLCRGTHRV